MRWGIMGTARIAVALLTAIREEGGEVVAVSSGSRERAERFAADHGVARWYGQHHDLVADDDVEVVYIATTNDRHHADLLACIAAGRPVLAEKPFTLTLDQATEVVAAARAANVFVMEAMWMRFQPAFLEVERRVADGQIGQPRLVQADFGFPASDPTGRLFTAELGGGSLLDIGIYPLTLACSFLGEPTEARALGEFHENGVDTQVSAAMRHERGLSSWSSSFVADTGVEATVAGTEGSLRFEAPFHHSARITRRQGGEVVEEFQVPDADLMYRHEVREVYRCLQEGATESPRMPLDFTLMIMSWLDHLQHEHLGITHTP